MSDDLKIKHSLVGEPTEKQKCKLIEILKRKGYLFCSRYDLGEYTFADPADNEVAIWQPTGENDYHVFAGWESCTVDILNEANKYFTIEEMKEVVYG